MARLRPVPPLFRPNYLEIVDFNHPVAMLAGATTPLAGAHGLIPIKIAFLLLRILLNLLLFLLETTLGVDVDLEE